MKWIEKYRNFCSLTFLLHFSILFILPACCASSNDTITPSQPLKVGQTLISAGQIFELGFFSPGNSNGLYVGIWYKTGPDRRIVWVANRGNALSANDSASRLLISLDGNLRVEDGKQNSVWKTNASIPSNSSSIAVLKDDGDFILKGNLTGETLWESYKDPCDTLLPTMPLDQNSYLTSWKSENDPAPGNFRTGLSHDNPTQIFSRNDTKPYWRSGPWNGWKFIGIDIPDKGFGNGISVIQNYQLGTASLTFSNYNKTYMAAVVISANGTTGIMHKDTPKDPWKYFWSAVRSPCDVYGTCGPFSVCSRNGSPICECLKGFSPLSNEEWSKGNWTRGCSRRTELMCATNSTSNNSTSRASKPDGFLKISQVKLPDHHVFLFNQDTQVCRQLCLNNCSCIAYAIPSGIGCMVWLTNLLDTQQFIYSGEDLYLRLAHSELGAKKKYIALIVSCIVISVGLLFGLSLCFFRRWKAKRRGIPLNQQNSHEEIHEGDASAKESSELPMIDFIRIKNATTNFSETNKLGEGGFGTVYVGRLEDGQQIAVKRLSSHSGQGMEEFKNEVILISKLQHRNLVRLLGCCIQGEEKIVILEYMKNKSLDKFLFDRTKRLELNWPKRFNIIQGIARGLLYLHRDSCLRIIHRDLKASNILLDDDLNPKISDFGLARTFRVTQELANTRRVVGTFGYMSPEYAMGGLFSEKSDVYSFGVLVLEIVSSMKNTGLGFQEKYLNLLGYTWQLWNEGRASELLDEALVDSCTPSEVMRCIQIGLLCVQDHASDRPTMSNVVHMLSSSESEMELPQPRQPTFGFQNLLDFEPFRLEFSTQNGSINDYSITVVEGR